MKNALIITDSQPLSQAIALYLKYVFNFECKYFTYNKSNFLSGEDFRKADLIIYELFRERDDNLRAEGIVALEKLEKNGKKVLIFSGEILGEEINSPIYWDLGSKEKFSEKIEKLISLKEINYEEEIKKLKKSFSFFLISAKHH